MLKEALRSYQLDKWYTKLHQNKMLGHEVMGIGGVYEFCFNCEAQCQQ